MAASVVTPLDDESVVLLPATYWIELEFDRPTPKADVLAALDQMGFVDVTLDQDTADQGGLFRSGAAALLARSVLASAPSSALTTPVTPSSSVSQAIKRMPVATSSSSPFVKKSTAAQTSSSALRTPAAAAPTFRVPAPSTSFGPDSSTSPSATAPAPASTAPTDASPAPGPLGPSAPDVSDADATTASPDASAAPTPDASAAPATLQPYFVDPQTGLQYFVDPSSGQPYAIDPQSGQRYDVDPQTGHAIIPAANTTTSATSPDAAAPSADVPYGADPSYALATDQIQGKVLDEVSGTSPWVYRFVARMPYTVTVSNVPGMFWKCIRTLIMDPWAEINFSVRPLPLKTNAVYELRFMSRDKKARARGDVCTLLEAMGFQPQKLLLFRKNVRIPRRPNVSVSEWLAIAKWVKAKSVTTSEDPFFFAEAKEV